MARHTLLKDRVHTMDTGAAGHVMPEAMFPNVKLERKTQPKKFVAANGDQIRDLGEKNIPSGQMKEYRGRTFCGSIVSIRIERNYITDERFGLREETHTGH